MCAEEGAEKISYTLLRSDRKTIAIQVCGGEVIVRAPQRVSVRTIDAFVEKERSWIAEKLNSCPVPQPIRFGITVPLWGAEVRLTSDAQVTQPGTLCGDALLFPEDTPDLSASLRIFYKKEAENTLLPRCQHLAAACGVDALLQRTTITHPKRRWGSCTARTGRIRLNAMLVCAAPYAADYVIVHELAHLRHMNHGAAFWAQVAAWMPEWEKARECLRRTEKRLMELEEI